MFHINIRGFISHSDELSAVLEAEKWPTYVGITESKLNNPVQEPVLHGYRLVSRRDRGGGSPGGGILMFAREGFEDTIVHIENSKEFEHTWHVIHSDRGPILAGLCYRPPCKGEVRSIDALETELVRLRSGCVGTLIMGDFNAHEKDWLRFSSGTSAEGRRLRDVCCDNSLTEFTGKPTHEHGNLLDLTLSDLETGLKTRVVEEVAGSDHCGVLATVAFNVPTVSVVTRRCFDYKRADWDGLRASLRGIDWALLFNDLSVDTVAEKFTETVLEHASRCIPNRLQKVRKSTHPWLNERCSEAIRCKRAAWGTDAFRVARDRCSEILCEEYARYTDETRKKLSGMPSSSRQWWSLAKSLQLQGGTSSASIPPLQRSDGSWATRDYDKAEVFADTFSKKATLPERQSNEYSEIQSSDVLMADFFVVRSRHVRNVLKALRFNSGTGPDGLSTRILKECVSSLVLPVRIMARQILREGAWPRCWCQHWIFPLHKKRSKAEPGNYRGIHLTPQISKVMERVLGFFLQPFFEAAGAYGARQYAYSKGVGHRDALAVNTLQWLSALEDGKRVGLYCSDVSGAFDRVPVDCLLEKLAATGLHPRLLAVLRSWLGDRSAVVVVKGSSSAPRVLRNSVFQGSVWGPPLRNVHYQDASRSVRKLGYEETVYADDFNAYKIFEPTVGDREILADMHGCQAELHKWGHANQAIFDASKEEFVILHRSRPVGSGFKLLGVLFDPKLRMHDAIHKFAVDAGWRLQALLRSRRFHSRAALVRVYKAQVLSFLEAATPAIAHACPALRDRIDRVQRWFFREMEEGGSQRLRLLSIVHWHHFAFDEIVQC